MNVFCKCIVTQETLENEVTMRYDYLIYFEKDKLEYDLLESKQCTIPLFAE